MKNKSLIINDAEVFNFKEKCTLSLNSPMYIAYCLENGFESVREAHIKLMGKGRLCSVWMLLIKDITRKRLELDVFDEYNQSHAYEIVKTLILRLKEKGLLDSVDAFLSGG